MKKVAMKLFLILTCLVLLSAPALAGEVYLSAAVSLEDVLNELSDNFAKQSADIKFVKNYGASGDLAKRIENGGPGDIFISANLERMDYMKNKSLMDNASTKVFTYNTLVFVGSTDKKVSGLKDLHKLKKIAIGDPKTVPAGEYAKAALKKAGVYKKLEKKLVMAKDVRACLMFAEQGKVDSAFVYKTDAMQAKQAKLLFAVPQDLYPRVTYPMGLTLKGAKNKDAEAFYKHLQSEDAKAVLEKFGFPRK